MWSCRERWRRSKEGRPPQAVDMYYGIGKTSKTKNLRLIKEFRETIARARETHELLLFWENRPKQGMNMPPEINTLASTLTSLRIIGDTLPTIPSALLLLSRLTKLVVQNCKVTAMPENMEPWQELEILEFQDNELIHIPRSIMALKKLKRLNLRTNHLTDIPPGVCSLPVLEELILDNNRIAMLPKKLVLMTKLKTLRLTRNLLTELPDGIGHLKSLELFYCNSNKLTWLPDEIGDLPNLRELRLGFNQIAKLPEEFGEGALAKRYVMSLFFRSIV